MSDLDEKLLAAADLCGIEPGYWDISGRRMETLPEVRLAILRALRVPCDDAAALDAWIFDRKRRRTETVQVLDAERPKLRVDGPGTVRILLAFEDGGRRDFELTTDDGVAVIPDSCPNGYHLAIVTTQARTMAIRLILCPARAWLPPSLERGQRRAGLAVSLYGVRSAQTWGCGDFTALRGVIDWAAVQGGGDYIALNPLNAIHNRQPFNTSPYLPNSSFYRNFIYLDIDRIEDLELCAAARAMRHHESTLEEIRAVNDSEFVEYERVAALKLRFLKLLHDRFEREELAHHTPRADAFEFYARAEGTLLERFALYSALDEYLHSQNQELWIWPDWPEPFRDPRNPHVLAFEREYASVVRFYKYVQWQLDIQAREAQDYARACGMEIGIFHDLPLATDRCGAELWSNREFYVPGCRVGAPPDDFSPKGQDWSFPPPDKEAHRRDVYRLFAESIRKSALHGGALRIDHVMRLFRLYWIPDGFDATQGAYVRDHAQDLLRVLALESQRLQVLIVGEDLGTVEPAMREALHDFGILSYRLFYFERNGAAGFKKPSEYPVQALVSSTTHDLPTLAGFWAGTDIETRRRLGILSDEAEYQRQKAERNRDKHRMMDCLIELGLLSRDYPREAADGPVLSGELHNAITGFLVSTPSLLMTLNQEDLTKELDQQNLPGTTWEYPNWRRKMKFTVEELHDFELPLAFASMLRHWLVEKGRCR